MAIFSSFEASTYPAPLVAEFKSKFYFKFWSMVNGDAKFLKIWSFEALQAGFFSNNFFVGELYFSIYIGNLNVATADLDSGIFK